jgi:hypothetical protein
VAGGAKAASGDGMQAPGHPDLLAFAIRARTFHGTAMSLRLTPFATPLLTLGAALLAGCSSLP